MGTKNTITRLAAALLIAGAVSFLSGCGEKKSVAKKKAEPAVVEISLPPPPPLVVPPPPKEEPPPEPKEEEMVQQEEIKEVAEPEPSPVEEPPALGTNLAPGNGPDSGYGLAKGGGTGGGNGRGTGGKGGGRFDRYAALLQSTLASELRRNSKTRASTFSVQVSLRIDADGRIISIKPKSSTGAPSLDQALRNDFIGVRFSEPPPADMPMPIHTRLTGRKR